MPGLVCGCSSTRRAFSSGGAGEAGQPQLGEGGEPGLTSVGGRSGGGSAGIGDTGGRPSRGGGGDTGGQQGGGATSGAGGEPAVVAGSATTDSGGKGGGAEPQGGRAGSGETGGGGEQAGQANVGTGGEVAAGGDSGASTGGGNGSSGAAGTPAEPTLSVAPSALPHAHYHQDYSASFTVSGGEAPYTWALSSGELPSGLTLSGSGALSGAPSEDGDFGFEIAATDANGAEGTMALSLEVQRKRFLAYVCDEDTEGENLLTLVDVANSSYPKSRVPIPEGSSVGRISFSPNGHWLAYELMDSAGVNELYVLDVTGRTFGEGMRVGGPGNAERPNWTPSGEAFAFGQQDEEGNYKACFVDLGSTLPPTAVPIEGANTSGTWVTDELLIFSSNQGQVAYTRRAGSSFGLVRTLNLALGVVNRVAPTGERVNLVGGRWNCADNSWIIDFAGPTVFTLPGVSSVSSDFEWFTLPDGADTTRTALHRYADLPDSAAVETIPASACASVRAWTHLRPAVFWVDNESDAPRVHLTELGSTITSREIPGTYTLSSSGTDIRVAPNDEWIEFAGLDGSGYIAPADGEASAFTASISTAVYSPDSQALLYSVSATEAPSTELYLLDLSSGTPGTPRPSFATPMEYISYVLSETMWSTEGTLVAYTGKATSSDSMSLYIVDVRDAEDTGTMISPYRYCSGSPCRDVESFAFQP